MFGCCWFPDMVETDEMKLIWAVFSSGGSKGDNRAEREYTI